MYFDKNGRKIFYRLDGNPAGRRLVLLNSLGTSTASWAEVVDHLSRDYHVLRIDKAGHGQSDPLTGPRTISDNAEDVRDVLSHLGWHGVDICGISIGAMTAIELAGRHPGVTGKLVLSNTSAHVPPEGLQQRIERIRQEGLPAVSGMAVGRFFSPGHPKGDDPTYRRTLADFEACDAESYIGWCQAIIAMDLRPLLPGIANRCMTIIGKWDEATPPAMGQAIASSLQNVEVVELNSGHLPYLEDPAGYAARLHGFLSQ
mgnify:CR=1 FL=1|jgi:Predicted hydrolases or acyltransferases (alpha/beta hydrolase superfamily)